MTSKRESDLELAATRAEETAKRWAEESTGYPDSQAARLLADVLEDPSGLNFTVEFVDGVIRPEDMRVAAHNLEQITREDPKFLPEWLRIPARVGGQAGFLAPQVVVRAARKAFSLLVGDLLLDVSDHKLGPAIARLRADGSRLNLNLLGEAVLGDAEADRRLAANFELLQRDDVDYISMKVSAVTGPHAPWAQQSIIEHAAERLLPLYRFAANSEDDKFINLDMEEYRDLDMTVGVFKNLLDREELKDLHAGIAIQAYLPDALSALKDLTEWARARVAAGGAPIKVRLVKGANLAMENVEAEVRGWHGVTWESKQASDANYLRCLDLLLTKENAPAVNVGIAGHNLFTMAAGWELAGIRDVRDYVDIEMLSGMASAQAQAIRTEVGNLLLYVPVVHPKEFDVSIAYLVRRLEENSAPENFMASIFDVGTDSAVFKKELVRFREAMRQLQAEGELRCHPNRVQDRSKETAKSLEALMRGPGGQWRFVNTPDTDPSLAANREWMDAIVARVAGSELGEKTVRAHTIGTKATVSKRLAKAEAAGRAWRAKTPEERSEILHRVGIQLALHRAEFIEVAASELGKLVDQTDPEVSEAIDFAHYYAETSLELSRIHGAEFQPANLTVVTPPWNFPVSIPLGGVVGALAAGSPVILKPATIAKRCGAVIAECLWEAGVDKDLCQLIIPSKPEVGRSLVEDPRVDRVILTGSSDTAERFLNWRPDLALLAETSGKNSIIVTPSADFDLAVRDVVASAYGHAGQKCSAASLVILVGSAGQSERFRNQLIDAVRSLEIGWPTDLAAQMGPLSEKPGDKLKRGLTHLDYGEHWVVRPKLLDDTGRLWSPGLRAGVQPHSEFHQVEYFGPILGVIRVETLEEAVDVQNGTEFGLTAGLQSLSVAEVNYWLDRVAAGNIYINRSITGAIVQRQPFGGWKRSSVGPGAKAGGPNYLFGFGTWKPVDAQSGEVGGEGFPAVPQRDPHITKPQLSELVDVAKMVLTGDDLDRVVRAAYNAQHACETEFDLLNDPSELRFERNVLRYIPARSILRADTGVSVADVLCVAAAAVATGEYRDSGDSYGHLTRFCAGQTKPQALHHGPNMVLSTAFDLPPAVYAWAEKYGFGCVAETRAEFEERLLAADLGNDGRVRLLGQSRVDLATDIGASIDLAVWDGPATTAARVEAIPFLHEQAVSMTTHRFGTPSALGTGVL